jgi:hypothetical protein
MRAVRSKNERVELEMRILKYRQLARTAMEQKLREIDE